MLLLLNRAGVYVHKRAPFYYYVSEPDHRQKLD